MGHVDARHRLQHLAREVRGGTVAERAIGEFARVSFRVCDQLLQRTRCNTWVRGKDVRGARQQYHRLQVLQCVVRQILDQRLVDGKTVGDTGKRVAVGRLGGGIDPNDGSRAGPVLDEHLAAERFRHILRDHSHGCFHRTAARGKRHDDAHGPHRPGGGLRPPVRGAQGENDPCQGSRRASCRTFFH